MPTAFTPLLTGEASCHKVLEDERHLAFLEPRPLTEGHTIVVPKKEIDYLFDLDDEALAALMVFAKKAAGLVRAAVPCRKIAVMVYGLQVRHAHVHLVPAHGVPGELNLSNAKLADDAALAELAKKINRHSRVSGNQNGA